MGRPKYNHTPGKTYLTHWTNWDGDQCYCLHVVVDSYDDKPNSTRLTDKRYHTFCVYTRHSCKSGFGTSVRDLSRGAINTIAKHAISADDAKRDRLKILILTGTTVDKWLEKGLKRYRKHRSRYAVKIDPDRIEKAIKCSG